MNNFLTFLRSLNLHDLRVWLIVIGILFIAGVWLYNRWQERRMRARFTDHVGRHSADVLAPGHASIITQKSAPASMSDLRKEPGFKTSPMAAAIPAKAIVSLASTSGADDANADTTVPGWNTQDSAPELNVVEIDEEIHALILLATEQPMAGERILAHLQGLRHAGRQNVVCAAAPLDAAERTSANVPWIAIEPGGRYDNIVVAVQLANRSGPLNEIEYSQFVTALQEAAEEMPASCDAPEMMETIARARALDARCAPLDAQIGVNIANAEGSWPGEVIDALARQYGLGLRADGRYHAFSEQGLTLFALQNADAESSGETGGGSSQHPVQTYAQPPGFRADTLSSIATRRITLLLDVPRVPQALTPYAQMKRMALAMASDLHGIVVDDDLRSLTPAMLDAIEREIEPVYTRLQAEGIAAGSARAMRLFG